MAKDLINHAHIMDLPLKTLKLRGTGRFRVGKHIEVPGQWHAQRAKKLHVPFHMPCHTDLFHLVVVAFIINQ